MSQVTQILSRLAAGHDDAFDELYGLLYPELRALAHSRIRRSGEITLLDTTSLVHEAYLRFEQSAAISFRDRAQFMAYAASVMRSVVVDAIRQRTSDKRGGGAEHLEFDDDVAGAGADHASNEVLRVHEALDALSSVDPRLVRVVEMRYFAGMNEKEIAQVLNVGVRTVTRDWEKARLFLHASLR